MNRNTALVNLMLTTMFFTVTGVVGLLIAPIAFMSFDALARSTIRLPGLQRLTILSYPILCFLTIIGGWILFALRKHRSATLCSMVPMLNIVAILAFVFAAEVFG